MKNIIVYLALLIQIPLNAQNVSSLLQVADEMYKFGDIRDALEVYKQAVKAEPDNAYANYMSGKCYIETIHKKNSLPYLLKAYELDRHVAFNILYLIATSYQLDYNFSEAIKYYELYKTKISTERENDNFKSADELKKIERRVEECNNGIEFLKHPQKLRIENMGVEVNSVFSDYAPVVSADQSRMFFTSRRLENTGGNKANDNEFYEDIYVTERRDGVWSKAQNAGPTINTNLHEASIGLSPDGKTLFIYKDDNKNIGDIFMCELNSKGKWTKPESMGNEINTKYIENSVAISKDGKTLFFASNRPGGFGGMDIYMSKKIKKGSWGKPENLGNVINTEFDDEGPFIDADGQTLYFSSKGHKGMGGFDIYKSLYDDVNHKWSEPSNLGLPINSPDDDIYFVVPGEDEVAYYATVKDEVMEGTGDVVLFRIYLKPTPVKDTISHSQPTPLAEANKLSPVVLNISIFSNDSHLPLDARIQLIDMASNKVLLKEVAENGKFQFSSLKAANQKFLVSVSKEGYMYKKVEITMPAAEDKPVEIVQTIDLDKVQVGSRYILRNVYFDFDKTTLKEESYPELDKLYSFLIQNPKVKIEIDGHTDSKGSVEYNKQLSKGRSQSVKKYLVKKGIGPGRITSKGFGKSQPLVSNDDEEDGRELNRRTEFVITKK